MRTRLGIAAILLVAVGALTVRFLTTPPAIPVTSSGPTGAALVEITLPDMLSDTAQIGQQLYQANCAVCHNINAVGQDGVAPPLVHVIYEPSHHGDESFQRAAATGVAQHHWPFGDMPPVSDVTRTEMEKIVTYIRELQRANGIQ